MVELPPSEGDEATITAMSPLATVGQYLSTNSAKSTFLHNTGLVVKAISSKLPHDQDTQAQSNVVYVLQTQVHSLTETLCETGETLLNVIKICMVLKPDYQTFSMLFRRLGEMKAKFMVLHRTVQHENITVKSNELSF